MRKEPYGHGYRPAGRTERIGSSTIRVIRRLPSPAEDRQDERVTFTPGGSARPGQFPELERLKDRSRREREAVPMEQGAGSGSAPA